MTPISAVSDERHEADRAERSRPDLIAELMKAPAASDPAPPLVDHVVDQRAALIGLQDDIAAEVKPVLRG